MEVLLHLQQGQGGNDWPPSTPGSEKSALFSPDDTPLLASIVILVRVLENSNLLHSTTVCQ